MDLRTEVISGIRWTGGARFSAQLVSWGITIVVMRLLTPADYGLMAMAGVFVAYMTLMNDLGLREALIQRPDIDEITLRQAFALLLLLNIGSFLLLFLAAPLAAAFFDEQRIVPMIRVLSTQFIVASFCIIPEALLSRKMQFKKNSVIDLASAILGSVATLILAMRGFGVWALVWGSLVISVSRTVGLNIICPFVRLPLFSLQGMGEILAFGGYATVRGTLWFLFTQADIFIIGRLLGHELLGIYSVGASLASMPMDKVSGIINQVAFPAFSKIQKDSDKVASNFLKATRVVSILAFPVLWGLSSVAPEMIHTLLGDKWLEASVPLQLLSLIVPLRMLANLITTAVTGTGHPKIAFSNVLLATLVMPLAIIIGAQWGLAGVGLAWVLVFPLVFLRNIYHAAPTLGVRVLDVLSTMAKPALAALAMYAVVLLIKLLPLIGHESNLYLVLLVAAGALAYPVAILALNRQGFREVLGLIRT